LTVLKKDGDMTDLIFKKIEKDDVPFINNVRNTYAKEFLHDNREFTLSETYEWLDKSNPNYWIIFLDNERIGYFRLSNYSPINRNIYIGADISPKFKGKGYGKLSYRKFLPFVFENFYIHKISLEVLSTNTVAISLYKKLGFFQEGIKRDEVFRNGKWVDSIIMSLLKNEYDEKN